MRSPKNMEVIQIELTNACVHSCSNCTRFCGHHKKPFFMDFETFKRAVDSLSGYTGIVGMMGGEPTLHPQFERFTEYLNSKFKIRGDLKAARKPLKDFLTYTRAKHNANRVLNKCAGPGLWTSITEKYHEHYELIQDTFTFQCFNDHSKPSYHHPLLVSRKDLGIPDEEWCKLRDKCWIQNCWSASVTPKGAFFCEIAGALDMLFDGPGGWPVTPGWWKITPERFGKQLEWCELCGGALTTFRRDAREGIYDVTPSMYERLAAIDSPLIKAGKVKVFDAGNFVTTKEYMDFESNQYIDDFSNRMGDSAKYLKGLPVEILETDGESFGSGLYYGMKAPGAGWFLYSENEIPNAAEIIEKASAHFLNNGVLYKIKGGDGVWLFNVGARALRRLGGAGILNARDFSDIVSAYSPDKIIETGFDEDELAADEPQWRKHCDNDFLNADITFKTAFRCAAESGGIGRGSRVLVTQTASYFLTRGLIALLKELGAEVFLVTHKRFAGYFGDIMDESDMLIFDSPEAFSFEALKPALDKLKRRRGFDGAVVPYSVPRSAIADNDGYQNIEKCVNWVTGNVFARVNIKREFVTLEFDTYGEVFENQWRY